MFDVWGKNLMRFRSTSTACEPKSGGMSDLLVRFHTFLNAFVLSFIGFGTHLSASERLGSEDQDRIEFTRDIQPLFAKHCLLCHGVDDSQGGLQLHSRANAMQVADSGQHAIVPGKADQSELLKRVVAEDPDLRMPPEGDRLSEEEVQALSAWIEQGANWDVHWAYEAIEASEAPEVEQSDWIRNEIDRFVLARLEDSGIEPSGVADRPTLMKRLSYDLLGLPPTPEELDAFVKDRSSDAYGKLVDRLLSSEHFGERWGRHWLDKARYADSDGYEKDNHRPDAWLYRDWVVNAINQDMPFDQFTIEQLAGDMLPGATVSQKLATAFHRQTLTNTEGGTDREQWRVAAVMDRTETLGTVWLGLSVGCARCHSHKYDQITQQEYYQLYAYFNNGDEVNAELPRSLEVYDRLQKEIAGLEEQLTSRRSKIADQLEVWLPKLRESASAESENEARFHVIKSPVVKGPDEIEFKLLPDDSYLVTGTNPEQAKYTIEIQLDTENVTGIQLEVLPHETLGASGPGRTSHGNFVLNEIRCYASEQASWNAEQNQKFVSAVADFSQDGWPVENAIDGIEGEGKSGTGWAISPQFGKPHKATFVFKEPLRKELEYLQIVLGQTYGAQHTIGRFRLRVMTGELPGGGLPEQLRQLLLQQHTDQSSVDQIVDYQCTQDPEYLALTEQVNELSAELKSQAMRVRVIGERKGQRRMTHVLRRGEFKQPMELVNPGTFTTLPQIENREGKPSTDRLDLAMWLVSDRNPIVPRVTVNHIWSHLFGSGIVPTMNDFGVRGDPPSHPKLLDHLSEKFIALGWSRKKLIDYIVNSSTYRQDSQHRPELLDVDPNNRLLHRQNRFRVEAEIIRDITLSVSGLLSNKIGGPSVFPPIPSSVTDLTYNSSFKWNTSEGEDRYRRGVYTYFKRTAPHPNLITFDCPDSNTANVQRDRSNTPIGALVTLNNQTFVEAARAMAERILSQNDLEDDRSRLSYALQLCLARVPASEEIDDFEVLLNKSRSWYAGHPESAFLMASGNQMDDSMKAPFEEFAEHAAWVATLRMVLNLDEFITRD